MKFLRQIATRVLILVFFINTNLWSKSAPESFADLAEELMPSVVNISTTQTVKTQANPFPFQFPPGSPFGEMFKEFDRPTERKATSLGSGFVIKKNGTVITNNHVIANAEDIIVRINNKEYKAKVIGADPYSDLAVLKIDTKETFNIVEFGNSDKARVGDWVMAIGNPFGLGGTVTSGIISARNRDINLTRYDDFIQTDASINQGNSGGPLFDMNGNVIGINTAIISPSGASSGIGFAIPVSTVKNITSQIIDFGSVKRGLLGVIISDLSEDVAEQLGLDIDKGALIQEVSPDSAAEDAGLEPGDVIIKVDDKDIENVNDLRNAIGLKRSGERVKIEIIRNNREIIKNAKLGEIAVEQTVQADEINSLLAGAELSDYIEDSGSMFGKSMGVIILSIEPNSNADRARLKAGDIIWAVGNMEVGNLEEFKSVTQDKDILILRVKRNGRQLIIQMRK